MIKYTLLALALAGAAGTVQAQTVVDAYGRPIASAPVISSPPQPSPGDYTRERPGLQPMEQQAQAVSPYAGTVRHEEAFRDEYGFRYDVRGNRIDARGRLMSPQSTTP
ncbi:MAG: hypothetical protein KIS73_04975 [Enhydrobacter sp.]|nr:hypothetical protein [Enhydrobacter sp.]